MFENVHNQMLTKQYDSVCFHWWKHRLIVSRLVRFCVGCSRERQGIPPAATARENTHHKAMVLKTVWRSTEAKKSKGIKIPEGKSMCWVNWGCWRFSSRWYWLQPSHNPVYLPMALLMVSPIHCLPNWKEKRTVRAAVAQWIEQPAWEPEGCSLDSQSGHMAGLWARCPDGGMWEATGWCISCTYTFLPLSFTLPSPL